MASKLQDSITLVICIASDTSEFPSPREIRARFATYSEGSFSCVLDGRVTDNLKSGNWGSTLFYRSDYFTGPVHIRFREELRGYQTIALVADVAGMTFSTEDGSEFVKGNGKSVRLAVELVESFARAMGASR
jgi:hypothetical protein